MPRLIINGEPGSTWTNDKSVVYWQIKCSLDNTCGSCLQYHMAIAEYWSVPLHRGCACRCQQVAPGEESRPFVDFRQILRGLPPDQQTAAVGAGVYDLLDAAQSNGRTQ